MKFVAIKWTFVFLISELCHGVTTLKPILEPTENEIVIQEGDELILGCHGKGRLHFTTQTLSSNINGSEFHISMDENSGKITFTRPNTTREDTGWYACAEEGVNVWNDDQNTDHAGEDIAWIYVYVNSSNPFAVDKTFNTIRAVYGDRIVIPCRTTSPANLSVQLKGPSGTNHQQTMDVTAHSTYDPKIGFILNEVDIKMANQMFECTVDGPETKSVSYALEFIHPLKCPKINLDEIRHVIRGRNLSVDCEIDVPHGTKWFNVTWQVPKSVPEGRLSIVGPTVVGDNAVSRTWKTNLRIENFEESYDGVYYCIANTSSDLQNTTTAIKSLDPGYTYIDARADVISNIVANETGLAQWKIVIGSYPEEFDWKWYDPHNQIILHNGVNESAKYSHRQKKSYDLFGINNLTVSDNGNYTIEFSNKKNRTVVNLKLTVHAQPSVSIDEVKPYYSPGESANFICHSYGKPLPNITWLIKEYPNITSKESLDVKLLPNPTIELGPKDDYHVVSKINVKINHGADLICMSCNKFNCVKSTKRIVAGKPQNNILWISIVCVLVFVIIVIVYLEIRSRLRLRERLDSFEKGDPENFDPNKPANDQAELLPYDKTWEVLRDNVKLLDELGKGAFGVVSKAEVRDIFGKGEVTIAAVKKVQNETAADMESLIRELKIMIYVGSHQNVVNLLGACTRRIYSGDELYVIVEYCRHGNLESYLQNHKKYCDDRIDPSTEEVCFHKSNRLSDCVQNEAAGKIVGVGNQSHAYVQHGAVENIVVNSNNQGDRQNDDFKPIRTEDLLQWACQVSQGMEYLSSKNVLHRDIATRNILLADNNTVKICDFGLAKNVYQDVNYMSKGDGPLPIKWMAVESIVDRLFSTQSDVWSFGIVLWEFFTLADTPYHGMEPREQKKRLFEGYRMDKPKYATDEIYNIMRDCWKTFPSDRPTFSDLTQRFSALINGSPSAHNTSVNYALPTMDRPYVSMTNGVLNNRPMNLDVNINIRDESFPLQMSSPTISDFEYCNKYPGPRESEIFGEQQADMSEESYEENPKGRDSGYSSVAMVSPPPNSTRSLSTQFDRNPLHRDHELFPDRSETINVSGEFSPSEINYTESSDSEDFNEYVGMLEVENLRKRGAGSSGQRFEDTPAGKVSGYCSIAMIPAPPDTSNQSSEGVTYVPVIQEENFASKLVSKQSNYVARPDGM